MVAKEIKENIHKENIHKELKKGKSISEKDLALTKANKVAFKK